MATAALESWQLQWRNPPLPTGLMPSRHASSARNAGDSGKTRGPRESGAHRHSCGCSPVPAAAAAVEAGGAFCHTLLLFCTHLLETAGSLEDNILARESAPVPQLCKAAYGQDAGQSFFRNSSTRERLLDDLDVSSISAVARSRRGSLACHPRWTCTGGRI